MNKFPESVKHAPITDPHHDSESVHVHHELMIQRLHWSLSQINRLEQENHDES